MAAVFTDYIAHEIKQNLDVCAKDPQLDHHYYATPLEPIINKVGKVNYGESNYASGPLTKTIYLQAYGTRYKVSVEDLKHVKGHGWITHDEADKLGVHYDKDLGYYIVNTPEYDAWLTDAREKNFPTSKQMRLF
jgi:hypothetical protein